MKLTMTQKIDLTQLGLTEEDQQKVCILANKIKTKLISHL